MAPKLSHLGHCWAKPAGAAPKGVIAPILRNGMNLGERKAIVSLERRQLFKNVYFSFCGIVSEERRRLFVERGRRLFEIRKCGGWQA